MEIALNTAEFGSTAGQLSAAADALGDVAFTEPELAGDPPAIKAFVEQARALQELLSAYYRALEHDVAAYQRIGTTLEDTDSALAEGM
ncbi:MAG: hypothetical protein E7001_03265 [Coriobacteriaceae bacterium]|nr:hypothetical protein [Coriobacteriaceae bacterium]